MTTIAVAAVWSLAPTRVGGKHRRYRPNPCLDDAETRRLLRDLIPDAALPPRPAPRVEALDPPIECFDRFEDDLGRELPPLVAGPSTNPRGLGRMRCARCGDDGFLPDCPGCGKVPPMAGAS